jgi:hypothetical protein
MDDSDEGCNAMETIYNIIESKSISGIVYGEYFKIRKI